MRFSRESFYRCIFSSPQSERVAHVRAWDAGEAEQLFRTELKSDGVEERGEISVRLLGDTTTGALVSEKV